MLDIISHIFSSAHIIGVSSNLLLAICSYESNLKNVIVTEANGSKSYGICMVKLSTAKQFDKTIKAKQLMDPKVNSLMAAKYLNYQLKRYNGNWCRAVASYNAGSFLESEWKGIPRNIKYVNRVRSRLHIEEQKKLKCRGGH